MDDIKLILTKETIIASILVATGDLSLEEHESNNTQDLSKAEQLLHEIMITVLSPLYRKIKNIEGSIPSSPVKSELSDLVSMIDEAGKSVATYFANQHSES
jgi:hypothetical protein